MAKNKTRRGRDVYIVAFRGSASKSDWTVNLNTDKVPYGGRSLEEFIEYAGHSEKDKTVPMVHKGFNDYVNTVLETMVDTNDDGIDEVCLMRFWLIQIHVYCLPGIAWGELSLHCWQNAL